MKNLFFVLLVMFLAATSCKKDDEAKKDDQNNTTEKVFAEFTPEQNKENVQQSGVEFVNELTQLENSASMQTAKSFKAFMELDQPNGNVAKSLPVVNTLVSIASFNAGQSNVMDLYPSLKSFLEDPTMLDEWNDLAAKYTWNSTTEQWDSTGLQNELRIEFPSVEAGTTNNALLKVYNFNTAYVDVPNEGLQEVPVSVSAELTVDGTKIMSVSYSLTLNNEKLPTQLTAQTTIDDFVFSSTLSNTNNTDASVEYLSKHGSKTLMKFVYSMKGSWSQSSIDDFEVNEKIEKVIQSGNVTVQLMDIGAGGSFDVKGFIDGLSSKGLDIYSSDIEGEADMETVVEVINQNVDFSVKYVSTGKILAEMNAQKKSFEDEWYDDNGNLQTGTKWEPEMIMVYADGSKVDMETYFDTGFNDFVTEVNKLITQLNTDFGFGLEPMEY
jgi:hypothetical protein